MQRRKAQEGACSYSETPTPHSPPRHNLMAFPAPRSEGSLGPWKPSHCEPQEAWEGREQGLRCLGGGQDSSDEGQSSRVPGPPGGGQQEPGSQTQECSNMGMANRDDGGQKFGRGGGEEEEKDARPEFPEEGRGTLTPGRRGRWQKLLPWHHWGWKGKLRHGPGDAGEAGCRGCSPVGGRMFPAESRLGQV